MNPEYEIERRRLGWLVCAVPGEGGIPLTAMAECLPIFKKNCVIHPGIAHHFNANGYRKVVVFAVGTPQDFDAWEKEIAEELKDHHPEDRWWLGTDVGTSSAAIFAALSTRWREPEAYSRKLTPRDSADFGRCVRLLDAIPEWRFRLGEVATKYADTEWPKIIARWTELEGSEPRRINEILHELNSRSTKP